MGRLEPLPASTWGPLGALLGPLGPLPASIWGPLGALLGPLGRLKNHLVFKRALFPPNLKKNLVF